MMKASHSTIYPTGYMWAIALGGPIKYISVLTKVPVHLIPKFLLLCLVLRPLLLFRATLKQCFTMSLMILVAYVGLHNHLLIGQVAFGFWALVPFLYGLFYPDVVLSERVRRSFFAILMVSIIGEVMSFFIVFPWAGLSAEFGGVTTTVTREWSSGSARRLAGFTISAIDLSLLFGIVGVVFIADSRQTVSRAALFLFFPLLILATTMKTAALAFMVACLPLLTPSKFLRAAAGVSGFLFLILGTLLPFYVNSREFAQIANFARAHKQLETLQERFDETWPGVVTYLNNSRAGIGGLGLGGLGSGNPLGRHPFEFASVDNLYLYALGTAGVIGAFVILILGWRLLRDALGPYDANHRYRLPLLVFLAIYGVTQPLFEAQMAAVILGALLSSRQQRLATKTLDTRPVRVLGAVSS